MKKQDLSIKTGDIFKLGEHRLLCGDALEVDQIKKFLKGKKIQLILTDPPYGVSYVKSKNAIGRKPCVSRKIKNDAIDTPQEYQNFTKKWLEAAVPYLKRKNAYYIFNSDKMIFSLHDGLIGAGFKFGQLLIWIKSQPVIGRKDYLPQHELIAYGWYGVHKFMKSKDKSLLFHPKPAKSKLHPTMKPVSLLRRLILNSTEIGEAVYDPFGGSGSTLIACEHTERSCLMVEMDPAYCATIIKRWEKLTGAKAEKLKEVTNDKR
ncbi:MAG: site-specific DNA-methyltransferase [Patescibacteria group bacterium]|nr:site-specific DNA-methyltransferase [Patescibacteria group bacterium]